MRCLGSLKRREQFQAVAATHKRWKTPCFILQFRSRGRNPQETSFYLRYGLTVSRKVGKAVQRNRIRRRLRHIIRLVLHNIRCSGDVVFIVHPKSVMMSFDELYENTTYALKRLRLYRDHVQ